MLVDYEKREVKLELYWWRYRRKKLRICGVLIVAANLYLFREGKCDHKNYILN